MENINPQVYLGIALVILVILVVINIKHIVRAVITGILIILCCICIYLSSPKELKDVASQLTNSKTIEQIKSLSGVSENIKVEKDDVSIKLGGKWVSIRDIEGYRGTFGDSVMITVNGKKYKVNDESVKSLLEKMSMD